MQPVFRQCGMRNIAQLAWEGDGRGLYGLVPAASQPPTDSCARYLLP